MQYILDAHWYREYSQKKIQPFIFISSWEINISPQRFYTDGQTEISNYRVASVLIKNKKNLAIQRTTFPKHNDFLGTILCLLQGCKYSSLPMLFCNKKSLYKSNMMSVCLACLSIYVYRRISLTTGLMCFYFKI